MNWKRKFHGSLLAFIGYLLSPLSWWNDAFVNLPLAVAFGWVVSLFYPPAFGASVILGYWLTNLLGFVLLHKGGRQMLREEKPAPPPRQALVRDLVVSLLYTALIVILVRMKVIQPLAGYFPKN
jgi:hypothetical protein